MCGLMARIGSLRFLTRKPRQKYRNALHRIKLLQAEREGLNHRLGIVKARMDPKELAKSKDSFHPLQLALERHEALVKKEHVDWRISHATADSMAKGKKLQRRTGWRSSAAGKAIRIATKPRLLARLYKKVKK